MPIRNDPRLYSEGAVTFNTQPSVNFYANLLARKRAKEDALDEYYRKLPSTINDAGVRDQERPIINQKVNDAMKYWMENKEAIRNPRLDNGKAQYELETMYRDARNTIDKSKQAGKGMLEFGKLTFQLGNEHLKDNPDIVDRIQRAELPVTDPNYQELNLAEMTRPPKPFGAKEFSEADKFATGNMQPKKVYNEAATRTDKTSGQVFVPYELKLTDEQIKKKADNFGQIASEDKSMQNHYWNQLHDPKIYKDYNDAYQSVYGKDDFVNTPVKAAKAASIISSRVPIGQGEEMRSDSELAFNRSLYKIAALGGGKNKEPAPPIDLRSPIYNDVGGGYKNLMPLMQGVKVTGLPDGRTMLAKMVQFNPETQMVRYQEYTDTPDEQNKFPVKETDLNTFLQNIKTNNPGTDMKFLEGLRNAITGNTEIKPKEQPKTSKPTITPKQQTHKIVKIPGL